jgi:hypothetical protein
MSNYSQGTHVIVGPKGHWVSGILLEPGSPYTPSNEELVAFPDRFEAVDIGEVSPDVLELSEFQEQVLNFDVITTSIPQLQQMIEGGFIEAQTVLEAELARPEDEQRVTLIAYLTNER